MTRKEAVALLERYSNYDGIGIPNLAGCKEAMRVAVDALKEAYPELADSEDERIRHWLIGLISADYKDENFPSGIKKTDVLNWLKKESLVYEQGMYYYDGNKFLYCQQEKPKVATATLDSEKQKECFADSSKTSASEDERIRKALIKTVKSIYAGDAMFLSEQQRDRYLAWLEKQKIKEKQDRMMPVYNDRDSFESALEKAWKSYNKSGARTVDSCEDDYVECAHAKGFREGYLFGIEKRKEQKPEITLVGDGSPLRIIDKSELKMTLKEAIENLKLFRYRAIHSIKLEDSIDVVVEYLEKEQKPVESISQLTVQGKGVYKICPRCKERMVRDDSMVYTSMPPQYIYECPKCGERKCDTVMYDNPEMDEQKPWKVGENAYFDPNADMWFIKKEQKPEWSEEDERILKGIIGKIDHDQTYGVSKVEMLSFLKSLRPSWKPSEVQMSMLLAVINSPNNAGAESCQLALRDLYQDLKKL